MAMRLGNYAVTEAGFGADLGAEKFLDIKCRMAGLTPDAVVVVATVRALKMHGGVAKDALGEENLVALESGMANLHRHVRNMRDVYGLPTVVAINRFPTDTEAELAMVSKKCEEAGVRVVLSDVWAKGGEGGIALAEEVVRLCEEPKHFTLPYQNKDSLKDKIHALVTKVYGGASVEYLPEAEEELERLSALGYAECPVCMAKTQYSFSDDATKLGAPDGFTVTVRRVKVSAGAGFVVVLTGNIMTMPGLPKVPAAEGIDVDENGKISGLF
jgi:formate--tetrahydrofolate ligase